MLFKSLPPKNADYWAQNSDKLEYLGIEARFSTCMNSNAHKSELH